MWFLAALFCAGCTGEGSLSGSATVTPTGATIGAGGGAGGGQGLPVPVGRVGVSVPPTSVLVVSAGSRALVDWAVGSGRLVLDEDQKRCLGARLDRDPGLRDGLGPDPAGSPRLGELVGLARDCLNATVNADRFAENLAQQAGGSLTPQQVGCVRDGYASLSGDDVRAIVQAGLGTGSSQEAEAKIQALLDACGVRRDALLPVAPG